MLWYAGGPVRETTGKPGSAFSKGDLLMLTSASSISRIPTSTASVGALAKGTIVGIAKASSLESLNGEVPYLVLQRHTVLWSDCTTGSTHTGGERLDVEYTGGTFRVTTSAISPMCIIDMQGADFQVNDSNRSRVRVMIDPTWLLYGYSN
jgi:hypothetical protein